MQLYKLHLLNAFAILIFETGHSSRGRGGSITSKLRPKNATPLNRTPATNNDNGNGNGNVQGSSEGSDEEEVSILKRCRSNVAVIIVRIVFYSSFFFCCLLFNHSFQTNPNRMTNCLKLLSLSVYNFYELHLLNAFVYFWFLKNRHDAKQENICCVLLLWKQNFKKPTFPFAIFPSKNVTRWCLVHRQMTKVKGK